MRVAQAHELRVGDVFFDPRQRHDHLMSRGLRKITSARSFIEYGDHYRIIEYDLLAADGGAGVINIVAEGRVSVVEEIGQEDAIMRLVKLETGNGAAFWRVGGRFYA